MENQNHIFIKSLSLLFKIVVALFLIFITLRLFFVKDTTQMVFGILLLLFFTIPTALVVFFKAKLVKKYPQFPKIWKILKPFYIASIIIFVGVLIWAVNTHNNEDRTKRTVAFINAQKITLDDVMGTHLPPVPDPKINDATIEGVDANHNSIRDDVELAIFKEYSNSAKIRAAMLQYAQALQLELTQVFNSQTFVGAMQNEDRAFDCISEAGPKVDLNLNNKQMQDLLKVNDDRRAEIEGLVFNTEIRRKKSQDNLNYTVTYTSPSGEQCDINSL